jgi:Polysaccharide biosynthesis C-terminal domain
MPAPNSSVGTAGTGCPDHAELSLFSSARRDVRLWGVRSAASLLDQAFTSGVGLAASVLLARWMSTAEYGAFAVAFAAYLFLTVFHNALLLEPTSVIGPARHAHELLAYFRAQLRLHGILVWPLAGVALAAAAELERINPGSPLPGALAGGGLALPLLLLLWLARRMCYVLQRPSIAVIGSAVYFGSSLACLCALHLADRVTASSAFLALGFCSLLGATVIFRQVGLARPLKQRRQATRWRQVLRENWRYGRWLAGSAVFYAIATSTPTFFVAGFLGLGSAGVLRAMQIPSLVMTQVVASIGLLVLPELSYDFGSGHLAALRHKAAFVGTGLGIAALLVALGLAFADARLERLLFSGEFANFAGMIPILALIPVANGFGSGCSMALRACQKPHYDLVSNVVGAIVSVVATILLVHYFGIFGAAIGVALSFVAMNVTAIFFFLRPNPNVIRERSHTPAVQSSAIGELQPPISSQRTTDRYV